MKAEIVITGYGEGELTLQAVKRLRASSDVVLHTENYPVAAWLKENGIAYASLDFLYEQTDDFDEHVARCLKYLEDRAEFTFCVMDASDSVAKALVEKYPWVPVTGGGADAALAMRAKSKLCVVSAVSAPQERLSPLCSVLIKEIDDRLLAGEVKLKLQQTYDEDAKVYFRTSDGHIINMKLSDLDRLKRYDQTCACLINPDKTPKMNDFECLRLIYEPKPVNDVSLNEEALAEKLADVVQCIQVAEERGLFTQEDVFMRAAELLSKGE